MLFYMMIFIKFIKININNDIIGIEHRKNAVDYCLKHKYEVFLCDARHDIILEKDVYFGWFGKYDAEKEIILNLKILYNNKLLIIFFSKNIKSEKESVQKHINFF